jgi:lytic murein transglycosylase
MKRATVVIVGLLAGGLVQPGFAQTGPAPAAPKQSAPTAPKQSVPAAPKQAAPAAPKQATPADAKQCPSAIGFERWLEGVKRDAMAQGVSQATLAAAAPHLVFDQTIIRRDRGQGVFQQSFLQFSDRMVSTNRMQNGSRALKTHAALFQRIEEKFGVPGPVLAAFWGLETDFGTNVGKMSVLRSVTTLAFDCRRPEFFRPQVIDALRVLQRGDLTVDEMMGDWAGEVGPMQFTPSDYFKYGVDFDGNGRRDLRTVPDALASSANMLMSAGWKRGEPWLQEVRVPANMPWDQADIRIQHPRSQWVQWGVRSAHGAALPADELQASLMLPMGRHGPAFLAYPNFQGYLKWNQAMVYAVTAAYYATRLAGAPPVSRTGANIVMLTTPQLAELQRLLVKVGYKGTADGRLGLETRASVKVAQQRLGMPPDSFPTADLIERLRTMR